MKAQQNLLSKSELPLFLTNPPSLFEEQSETLKMSDVATIDFHITAKCSQACPYFGFPMVAQVQSQPVQAGFHLLPGVYISPDGHVIQATKNRE